MIEVAHRRELVHSTRPPSPSSPVGRRLTCAGYQTRARAHARKHTRTHARHGGGRIPPMAAGGGRRAARGSAMQPGRPGLTGCNLRRRLTRERPGAHQGARRPASAQPLHSAIRPPSESRRVAGSARTRRRRSPAAVPLPRGSRPARRLGVPAVVHPSRDADIAELLPDGAVKSGGS